MTELEREQAVEAARARVEADMPYIEVGEARLFHYHAHTKRWYVEVDVLNLNAENGVAAMVLCRVSYDETGELSAKRVSVAEKL